MQTRQRSSKTNLNVRRKSAAIGYIQFAPQSQKANPTITIEVGLVNNNTLPLQRNDSKHSRSSSVKQFKTESSLLDNSVNEQNKPRPTKKIFLKNDNNIHHKVTETDTCYDTVNYQMSPVIKQEPRYYENVIQSINQQLTKFSNLKNIPKNAICDISTQQIKEDFFLKWQAQNQLSSQLDAQLQEYKKILSDTQQELLESIKQKQNIENEFQKFKLQHQNCQRLNSATFNQAVCQIEEQKEIIILLQGEVKEVKNKCIKQKKTIERLQQTSQKENLQCYCTSEQELLKCKSENQNYLRQMYELREKNAQREQILSKEIEYWKSRALSNK